MAIQLELRPHRRIDAQMLCPGGVQEYAEKRVPHHVVAYTRGALWVLASLALWYVLFDAAVGKAGIVPVLLVMLRGGWLILRTYEDWFVVTNMRILRIQGVFNQRTAAMSLSRIVDFTMEQPLAGQALKYGHLIFENAAQDQGLREIRNVPDVVGLNRHIQNSVFSAGGGPARHLRSDGGQSGMQPSTPRPRQPGDMDATGEIPRVT